MSASAKDRTPGWIPAPGTVIAGRYRLENLIGRGGMGAVLSGQHIALEDRVAVKFLDPELAGNLESIERFVREAKAAARIKSDHVVRVLDVGATEEGLGANRPGRRGPTHTTKRDHHGTGIGKGHDRLLETARSERHTALLGARADGGHSRQRVQCTRPSARPHG